MYVTRRLSEYQRNTSELPKEGPYLGVLIIQDEESRPTCCFGSCYEGELRGLPFPQNVKLTVKYTFYYLDSGCDYEDPVVFIPVLDKPLSSNRYYVIKRSGKHSGKATTSAKKEDIVPTYNSYPLRDDPQDKPQQPDPYDIYQQFKIHQTESSSRCRWYFAASLAPDGVPPEFLRRGYWRVEYSTSEDFGLGLRDDAKGIDTKLRSELPGDLNTSVVVGNWYVPFIFVNEKDPNDQLENSPYYTMTLHQKWEEVYSCENLHNANLGIVVSAEVETEVVKLEGQEINKKTTRVYQDGVVWCEVGDKKIGLRSVVVRRMLWEEQRFGWKREPRRQLVKKTERFSGDGSNWKSYKCYVLVESFVLQRMDQSLVLTYEFRHVDKLKSKWD